MSAHDLAPYGAKARLAALRSLASSTSRQALTYAGATGAASAANGLSKALLAVLLSVPAFAAFAVGQTILQYGAMLCEFGLFVPAGRACALAKQGEEREIIGGAIALYVPVAVTFIFGIVGISFFANQWFGVQVGEPLRLTAVFAIGWPFTFIGLQLAQGIGRAQLAALTGLAGSVLFLSALAAAHVIAGAVTVSAALLSQSVTILVAGVALVAWLRPRFVNVKTRMLRLAVDAKRYGLQVYVGRVLSIGTYNMDVLMLAAMKPAQDVAAYALAGAIATAAGLPVTALGTVLFARMARTDRISRKWLSVSWLLGVVSIPVTWAVTSLAVRPIFSGGYRSVSSLVIPLALAQTIRGVTGVYNSFLAAHGRGRPLRNASLILTLSNVALNFALIPTFAAQGAAWASVVALIGNWLAHIVGYRQSLRPPLPVAVGDIVQRDNRDA